MAQIVIRRNNIGNFRQNAIINYEALCENVLQYVCLAQLTVSRHCS
jgi:hypothetical protein